MSNFRVDINLNKNYIELKIQNLPTCTIFNRGWIWVSIYCQNAKNLLNKKEKDREEMDSDVCEGGLECVVSVEWCHVLYMW